MDPLPPETTTPMPPQLAHVYTEELGWPGRPTDSPDMELIPPPLAVKPHITPRRWPSFIAKMSDRSSTVTS